MKKVIYKFKRLCRFIGCLIYLFYYRIKFRNKNKGIAQVVESFNSGGLEQVAANIYKIYKDKNYPSAVITISNNVGPICAQLSTPQDLRIIYYDVIEMIKYCAKNNIGTLVYHFSTFHMKLFSLLGFKNYYIVHNTYLWYTDEEWSSLKRKLKYTKGIISVSKWCKNYFENKTGIRDTKLILNGINFNTIKNSEKTNLTREKLNIMNSDITCLTVGSYTAGKHQMAIIGIAEELIKINKNFKFICAGPVLDKKLYKEFLKKVNSSPAKNNFIILNYIPQEEMGDFISKNCDIYLQPSIHEAGVPLSVMEALLRGKPVVMTDFMISESFPVTDRIKAITPAFKNILSLTPKDVEKMARKTNTNSTQEYVDAILKTFENIKEYKDGFNINDYSFLSLERMSEEYLNYIKL